MSVRDLVTDLRTWWWRRERAAQLIRDLVDLGPGERLLLTEQDRFALVERLVAMRERLDDDAADRGPTPPDASARAVRRHPDRVAAAARLADRQVEGCAVAQRIIEARGAFEVTADEGAWFVAYWRWVAANRRVDASE